MRSGLDAIRCINTYSATSRSSWLSSRVVPPCGPRAGTTARASPRQLPRHRPAPVARHDAGTHSDLVLARLVLLSRLCHDSQAFRPPCLVRKQPQTTASSLAPILPSNRPDPAQQPDRAAEDPPPREGSWPPLLPPARSPPPFRCHRRQREPARPKRLHRRRHSLLCLLQGRLAGVASPCSSASHEGAALSGFGRPRGAFAFDGLRSEGRTRVLPSGPTRTAL